VKDTMMAEHGFQNADTGAPDLFEGYLDEQEYCRQRGVSLRTAQRDRQRRQSPPYLTVGKKVYYRVAAVGEWLLRQEREPGVTSSSRGDRGLRQ
jgi:hypothetical protein